MKATTAYKPQSQPQGPGCVLVELRLQYESQVRNAVGRKK